MKRGPKRLGSPQVKTGTENTVFFALTSVPLNWIVSSGMKVNWLGRTWEKEQGVRGKTQVIRGVRERKIYRDERPWQKQRRKHSNSLHNRIIPLRPTSNKILLRQHLILKIQHLILVLLGLELVIQSLLSSLV